MIVITCSFALALAAQEPECPIGDNACEAERFERRARESKTPRDRALRLHGAYLSYMSLYDKTGEARYLCNARRTFDASLAIKDQPASQRANFEAERPKLEQREEARGVRCGEARKPKKEAPRVAAAAPELPAAPSAPPDATPPTATPPPPRPPSASSASGSVVALLGPESEAPRPDPLLPVPRSRHVPEPRPGRPLVIAGGVTLGVGLALAGVSGYTGGRALIAYREAVALHEGVEGSPDDAARLQDQALETEFRSMNALALGTAITGGAAVIVGVVMSAVGGRRLARGGTRAALVPAPGGLALRARF